MSLLKKIISLSAGISMSFLAACSSTRNHGNHELLADSCMRKGTSAVANMYPGKKVSNTCPEEMKGVYENAQGPAVAMSENRGEVVKEISSRVQPHMPPKWGEQMQFAHTLYIDPSKRGDPILLTNNCENPTPSDVWVQYFKASGALKVAFTKPAVAVSDTGGKYAMCMTNVNSKDKTENAIAESRAQIPNVLQPEIPAQPAPPIAKTPTLEETIQNNAPTQLVEKNAEIPYSNQQIRSSSPTDTRQVYEVNFTLQKGSSLWGVFNSIGRLDALQSYMENRDITEADARKLKAGYSDTIALFLDDIALAKASVAKSVKLQKQDSTQNHSSIINLDLNGNTQKVAQSSNKSYDVANAVNDVKVPSLPESPIKPEYKNTSTLRDGSQGKSIDEVVGSNSGIHNLLSLFDPYTSAQLAEMRREAAREVGYSTSHIRESQELYHAASNAILGLRQKGYEQAREKGLSILFAVESADQFAKEQMKLMFKDVYLNAVTSCKKVSARNLMSCFSKESRRVAREEMGKARIAESGNPVKSLYEMQERYVMATN